MEKQSRTRVMKGCAVWTGSWWWWRGLRRGDIEWRLDEVGEVVKLWKKSVPARGKGHCKGPGLRGAVSAAREEVREVFRPFRAGVPNLQAADRYRSPAC